MPSSTNAVLTALIMVLAVGCSDGLNDGGSPTGVPVTASVPTFVEQIGSDGRVDELIAPDEEWTGQYPVRIIRKDENGKIVSTKIVTKPPTSLADVMRQVPLTAEQLAKVEELIQGFSVEMPESNASAALEAVREIRGVR